MRSDDDAEHPGGDGLQQTLVVFNEPPTKMTPEPQLWANPRHGRAAASVGNTEVKVDDG